MFESACPACFQVIGKQASETDLATDEARHLCQELILKQALDYFRSLPVKDPRSARRERRA